MKRRSLGFAFFFRSSYLDICLLLLVVSLISLYGVVEKAKGEKNDKTNAAIMGYFVRFEF